MYTFSNQNVSKSLHCLLKTNQAGTATKTATGYINKKEFILHWDSMSITENKDTSLVFM